MKKLVAILRSPGGMVTILGVLGVLVGPSISTIATDSNAAVEIVGVAILLAGYITIALGIVMIITASRRARGQPGPDKT